MKLSDSRVQSPSSVGSTLVSISSAKRLLGLRSRKRRRESISAYSLLQLCLGGSSARKRQGRAGEKLPSCERAPSPFRTQRLEEKGSLWKCDHVCKDQASLCVCAQACNWVCGGQAGVYSALCFKDYSIYCCRGEGHLSQMWFHRKLGYPAWFRAGPCVGTGEVCASAAFSRTAVRWESQPG